MDGAGVTCPICHCPAASHRYRDDGQSECSQCKRVGCSSIEPKPRRGKEPPAVPSLVECERCGDPSPALPREPVRTAPPPTKGQDGETYICLDVSGLGRDEREVVREGAQELIDSLRAGRGKYGELTLECDRDWAGEEDEEHRDAALYRAARRALVRRRGLAGAGEDTGPALKSRRARQ